MMSQLPDDICAQVSTLLQSAGIAADHDQDKAGSALSCAPLKGDGSSRRFWRIALPGTFRAIVVAPENDEERCLSEAGSVWRIGKHLGSVGVPVPELYGFDPATGILVCEDLGDTHLHSFACATDFSNEASVARLKVLYRQTLDVLVGMQCRGGANFDTNWCWDTPVYDRQLMLLRESGYFLRAFWQGLLGQQIPDGLTAEFAVLAGAAEKAPATFYLHRDFQSRNVMIADGRVRVIDFQGGRMGPLGYDLASLLIDPYADLPHWFQDDLYGYYLQQLQLVERVNREEFRRSYLALALQRNLQILGAFAYLSAVCGKPFFRSYIYPALVSLRYLLGLSDTIHLPILTVVAEQAHQCIADTHSCSKG